MIAPSPLMVARVKHGLGMQKRDPLRFWHHASKVTRQATASLSALSGGIEIFVRAGNKAGKTLWGAAAVVALCQRRSSLDGVQLPRMPKRVVAAVLALDHQQQALSVQPAYLSVLGDWPHTVGYKSHSQDIVGTIRVKQVGGSDDPRTWSVIHFISQENPNAMVGARLHIVHADEPPKEHIWNEVRARGFANQIFIRLITATPLVRRQWAPLKRWFPEEFTGQIINGRLGLKLSVYDNSYLTDEEKARLEDDYRDDPLRDARLKGEYVDATASCPFNQKIILHLLEKAMPPKIIRLPVARDGGTEEIEVEVWEEPETEGAYYMPLDASAGIADSLHDPGGIHVWRRKPVKLVARYNGYLPAYELGVLAANLGTRYNRALVDPETSGGWGIAVLKALEQCGYGNVTRQPRELSPGQWRDVMGFVTSDTTRPAMIAAIQDFIRSVRDGRDLAQIPSGDVLRCWLDTILNEKNKPVAAPGLHDEDLILSGQALRRLTHRADLTPLAHPERKIITLDQLFGRKEPEARSRMLIRMKRQP